MKKDLPECVIFDKDGTLIECASIWIPWAEDIYQYVTEKISQPFFSYSDLSQSFGIRPGNAHLDPRGPLAIGSVLEGEIILSSKLYEAGLSWDQAVLLAAEASSFANEKQNESSALQPIKGVKEFITLLHQKEIPMGVLTADDTVKAEKHLKAVGLDSYFDFIIGSDQVERGKPFPDMAYLVSEKFGFALSNSLIIGDTNADMCLGKNAGMRACIGFIPATEEKKDYLVDADFIMERFDFRLIESFFK
ncbi:hypothetical protein AC623_07165 [Bacillus sp. FJAT-27231]|uniref:HAD family hydrolase n=1 Tax=Bacillus sp. FJAT-27231 TaxID=1679168 RepID=UPI000670C13E|nr:HAD family phosphatase [Bacillus sp. FJAT-27231]KMY53779.1 hypothetical protein AC623_07165 [Bacillus sp. FJAT-27231]